LTEDLDYGFSSILDSWIRGKAFAQIGIVTAFSNRTIPQVSVQPAFQRVYYDSDTPKDIDPIENVPVVYPGGGDFLLEYDIVIGSSVLLIFADRSIAAWFQTGNKGDPSLSHTNDLSDAIAVPGVIPTPGVLPSGVVTGGMALRNKAGTTRIGLSTDGSIALENSAGNLEISAAGIAEINGNFTVLP